MKTSLFMMTDTRNVWARVSTDDYDMRTSLGRVFAGDIVLFVKMSSDCTFNLCLTKHGVGWIYSLYAAVVPLKHVGIDSK